MHLQPANFDFIDPNWKPLKGNLPIFEDSNPKELGYGGRDYQIRCYSKFHNKHRTIFIAPTGSGKSLVSVFNAAREIIESDYKQKQVFVVPQLNIGHGFTHHKHEKLNIDGKVYPWEITLNCCPAKGYLEELVVQVSDFLLKKHACKSHRANGVLGGCTMVVSYAALLAAFNKMTPAQQKKAIQNTSFRLDEVHHISGVDDNGASNQLGKFCKFVLDNDGSLHLTTATFFRGDKNFILSNEYLDEFELESVEFLEHWKTLGLRELHQNYCCYKDGDDLLKQILDSISSEPNQSPLIIVPSDGEKYFRETNKWEWVKKLMKGLNKIYGADKVLDLVSPERQYKDKARLAADSEHQDFSAVITCAIGREGTDWPACSRVYNTVLDGNVVQPIQKLGRALRQYNGKTDVKMINYIEHFESWDVDSATIRDKLSDRFNAVLARSMLTDMIYTCRFPTIFVPREDGENEDDWVPKLVSLEDVYGCRRNELIEDMMRRVLSLTEEEQTDESIDKIIDSIISDYEEDQLEDVDYEVLKNRLRKEIIRIQNPEVPNLMLDETLELLIRENGWDKVVREHIAKHSPFVGLAKTEDLEQLQKLLKDTVASNKKKLLEIARNGEAKPVQRTHPLGSVLGFYTNPHENNRMYDPVFDQEIRALRPDWFVDTAAENKKLILEMARNGDPLPIGKHNKLRMWLRSYLYKNGNCYDAEFDKEVHKLRPDWFVDQVVENKHLLIKMAKNGDDKPIVGKHPLGAMLTFYISVKTAMYDAEFDREIRILRPDWFVDTAAENKKELLEMARRNEKRPNKHKQTIGQRLVAYTSKNSNNYDAEFDREIRVLRPDWFADTASINKELLIKMAKNGDPRPSNKTKIGQVFNKYIQNTKTNTCYDANFDEQIRLLRTDWFNKVDTKKKQLLEIAKNGDPRPSSKSDPLGKALVIYTNNSKGNCSYDAKFNKQIRALRPDWFVGISATSTVAKKEILEMAKNGEKRPSSHSHPLGGKLVQYLCKTSCTYDAEFASKIRKLRPDWFRNKMELA